MTRRREGRHRAVWGWGWLVVLVGLVVVSARPPSPASASQAPPRGVHPPGVKPWHPETDDDGFPVAQEGTDEEDEWDLLEDLAEPGDEDAILTGQKTAQQVIQEIKQRKAQAHEEAKQRDQQQQKQQKAEATPTEPKEAVTVLTTKTFDDALSNYPFVLVEFIAPWCGHCRKLAPEFEEAARQLAYSSSVVQLDHYLKTKISVVQIDRHRQDVLLAKVDCTVDEELARRYDVRGYPTMKYFRHGKYIMEYELGRTAEEIVVFMKQKSNPATVALQTVDEVNDFLSTHPTCLFVYALPNSDALLSVRDSANRLVVEDFSFAEVSDVQLIESLGEHLNTAKIFRNFSSNPYLLTDLTPESVLQAVLTHGYPAASNGPDAWDRATARQVPVVILFIDKDSDNAENIFAWFNTIAKAHIENFAFLYAGKEFHSRLVHLGASGEKIPTVVVVDPETTQSWPFDETMELNQQNVEALLQDISEGTLRPHYASQKPPATNDGVVITVVGDTFEELVLNNDKHVIVEFYAPWCGHCKQLAPTWEKLGEHYKDNANIVVAQIDASANDNPSVVVKGYPSIYLFPSGKKDNPIEYTGLTRNLQDFISFVDEHTSKPAGSPEQHGHSSHDEL